MYKIMLCCSAGMSTSLLVRKMVEAANERDLPVQIDAYGVSEFDMQFPQYHLVRAHTTLFRIFFSFI